MLERELHQLQSMHRRTITKQVVSETLTWHLLHTFDYRVPDAYADRCRIEGVERAPVMLAELRPGVFKLQLDDETPDGQAILRRLEESGALADVHSDDNQ